MADTFDVVGTRDIPAPLDEAWKSWTDPDYVRQWWGPNGFACTVADMDVRVGGRSLVCMSAPDWGFPALYSTWAYTLVDAPNRLEFVHNMSDEHGTTIDAEGIPRDVRHVITFEPMAPDAHPPDGARVQLPYGRGARPVEPGPRGVPRQARRGLRLRHP